MYVRQDKNVVGKPSDSVAEKMEFDGVATVRSINLNFSRKRNDLKWVDRSGAVAAPVKKARKVLEEMNFLNWFIPFLQLRKTKSNLPSSSPSQEEQMFEENADSGNYGEYDHEEEEQPGNCGATAAKTNKIESEGKDRKKKQKLGK